MDVKLDDILKENISEIIDYAEKFNYGGCWKLSNSLTQTFYVLKSERGIFIAEFIEYLFTNIEEGAINTRDEKEIKMKEEVVSFLKGLQEVSIFTEENDKKIMEKLIDIRYKATRFQLRQREARRDKRLRLN